MRMRMPPTLVSHALVSVVVAAHFMEVCQQRVRIVLRSKAWFAAGLYGRHYSSESAHVFALRAWVTSCAELLSCGAHTHHDTWSHALELNVVVAQQTAHLAFLALVAGRKQDAAPTRHAWRASRGPEAPDAAVPSAQLGVGKRAQS